MVLLSLSGVILEQRIRSKPENSWVCPQPHTKKKKKTKISKEAKWQPNIARRALVVLSTAVLELHCILRLLHWTLNWFNWDSQGHPSDHTWKFTLKPRSRWSNKLKYTYNKVFNSNACPCSWDISDFPSLGIPYHGKVRISLQGTCVWPCWLSSGSHSYSGTSSVTEPSCWSFLLGIWE